VPGTPQLRLVLGLLALQAGQAVPARQLIDALWGDHPPRSARNGLNVLLTHLRKILVVTPGAGLIRVGDSFELHADQAAVDVHRFRELVRAARATRDRRAAVASFDEALALWRGPALAGVAETIRAAEIRDGLAGEHLSAAEDRVGALLACGRHVEAAAELPAVLSEHPLRESVAGMLMLALYRCGRQADALAVFRRTRETLIAELGIEPGTDLQQLHRRILGSDPGLTAQPLESATQPPSQRGPACEHITGGNGNGANEHAGPVPVPRQLPAAVPHFTGRTAELKILDGLLDEAEKRRTMPISAISGTAGVGKTALAVHWAHRVAGRFPDGQLYVNLRGYDQGQPVLAADALVRLLRSLGTPGHDIPPDEDERTVRYRSLLAGRRLLIVLDNAGSTEQVRQLLPGTPGCAVLVTSRDALAGLVARDGAARLNLDLLSLEEAVALLRTLTGARAETEPAAAAKLAVQCCRLPLALRVAAELAAARPGTSLTALTGELADARTRLDLLAADGDPRTGVRAVFSCSYRHLGTDLARTFRLLGLHPGPDVEPYAAAALTGATVPQARRALGMLARAHLLSTVSPCRYGMHDLLRGYACELTADLDGAAEQRMALTRLFDHHLYTAAAAMDALFPAERHRRPRIPRPATPVPPLPDPAAARDWLDSERDALVAAAGHTAAHGWPGHATRLAVTLASYLRSGDHIPEVITVFNHALGAARRTGDCAAEATVLNEIGYVDWELGRLPQAIDRHREALALFREVNDQAGEAHALSNIGLDEMELGRYEQAAQHQQEAMAIFRDVGDRFGEARALGNLGLAWQLRGRYQEAAGHYRQSLGVSREIGDRAGEGYALGRLGVIDLRLGRYQHAAGYLGESLTLFGEIGNTVAESEILIKLGEVYRALGRYQQAVGNFEQALARSREIGDRDMEADALNGLGDVRLQAGETDKARVHHATALRLASNIGVPLRQAHAHTGLARAYQADGDLVQARHHLQEALTRYTAIGAPEAAGIRARLAEVSDGPAEEADPTPTSSPGSP